MVERLTTEYLEIMKPMRWVLLMIFLLSSGCTTSVHLLTGERRQPSIDEKLVVYVTNPSLARELEVLRASGLYRLADRESGATKLKLREISQSGRCGNSLMLTMITFGLVPGYVPGAYTFSYELENKGQWIVVSHRLPLYERISLWERFVYQDRIAIFADALKRSERTTGL